MSVINSNAVGDKIAKCYPHMSYDCLPVGHIRLLKIHETSSPWDVNENPNSWDLEEELEVSLISVPLDASPPYVALSYTWGEPGPFSDPTISVFTQVNRCFPVKCHGRVILITRNLRNALRRLRQLDYIQKMAPANPSLTKISKDWAGHNKDTHLYWIDAICIDQDDLQERSAQVYLMGRIYRQAQCTIAWLGEGDAYTASAIQAMVKVSSYDTKKGSLPDLNPATSNELYGGLNSLDDSEIKALNLLMARTWFTRTWILQEVVLPPSIVILLGSTFFSFDIFLRVGTLFNVSYSSLRFLGRALRTSEGNTSECLLPNSTERVMGTLSILTNIDSCRKALSSKQELTFMDVITTSDKSESTDLRDRIYGVFGMAAEFSRNDGVTTMPDYTLTVKEVYVNATAAIIEARRDLACLILTSDRSFKKLEGIPSWCPDYSSNMVPMRAYSEFERNWRLGLSWPDAKAPNVAGMRLSADGFVYDVVGETATLLKDQENSERAYGVSAIFDLAMKLDGRVSADSLFRQSCSPFEKLWRTLLLDMFDLTTPAPKQTALLLFPAFVTLLVAITFGAEQTWYEHAEEFSLQDTLKAKHLIFEDLQKLQSSMSQLKRRDPAAETSLPDIEASRRWVTFFADQIQPNGKYPNATNGLLQAAGIHIRDFIRDHRSEYLAMKMSKQADATSYIDDAHAQEVLTQHLMPTMGLHGRKFFSTEGNTLGAGHLSIQPGDEIWFLHGAYAPVVLRPLAFGNYQFVGEAYVHGVMYGEAGPACTTHRRITIE